MPVVPEAAYLDLAAERLAEVLHEPFERPSREALLRSHTERATLNRWRLALLSAGPGDILKSYARLMRSGRPRLMTLAVVGLAARSAGSDLEWLQVRRHRVSWPSRRHMRRHH